MTRSPSEDGFVDRLSGFSFLPPCYPSYRALAFALVRLFLTEYASLPWTHQHAGLSRRSPSRRAPGRLQHERHFYVGSPAVSATFSSLDTALGCCLDHVTK